MISYLEKIDSIILLYRSFVQVWHPIEGAAGFAGDTLTAAMPLSAYNEPPQEVAYDN